MKAELFKDSKMEWRIRIVARNGKIVWSTSESYQRKAKARHALKILVKAAKAGKLDVE